MDESTEAAVRLYADRIELAPDTQVYGGRGDYTIVQADQVVAVMNGCIGNPARLLDKVARDEPVPDSVEWFAVSHLACDLGASRG